MRSYDWLDCKCTPYWLCCNEQCLLWFAMILKQTCAFQVLEKAAEISMVWWQIKWNVELASFTCYIYLLRILRLVAETAQVIWSRSVIDQFFGNVGVNKAHR